MNTFLTDNGAVTEDDVKRMASECLGQKIAKVIKIGKGANSRVYHITGQAQEYVVKFYFHYQGDSRDRLATEFNSLSFLWEQGLRTVPQPIAFNRPFGFAVYGFIQGLALQNVSQKEIDEAVDFLAILRKLSLQPQAKEFPSASEAFFCAEDVANSIQLRLKRFSFDGGQEYAALDSYLRDEFLPLMETVEGWSRQYLQDHGVSWGRQLDSAHRTLSPSDFGFHNALSQQDGKLVFLDFEYFGWDDPVKTTADFLWHPAMNITKALKQKFVERMEAVFHDEEAFKARLKAFFPLFGLKWCLILLNEFVAVDMLRRDFAKTNGVDKKSLRLSQLAKAKALSRQIQLTYKDFPYAQ